MNRTSPAYADTTVEARFPEKFRLLHESRYCSAGSQDRIQPRTSNFVSRRWNAFGSANARDVE